MSASPQPRPASGKPAETATSRQLRSLTVYTSTGSENRLGSGTAIVPLVPYSSNRGMREAQTSKLMVTVDETPFACSRIALMWVSTSTLIGAPASGPVATARARPDLLVVQDTSATGPRRVTRLVR